MGYVIEDLVHHLCFKERTSDFWEMTLHHLLTLTLYGGMIMQNLIYVGVVISWLHSTSDITTALSRMLSQTVYKLSTVVSFGVCILSWILLRNYWMPVMTYASHKYIIYPKELEQFQHAPDILVSFLKVLCCMHLYWLVLFLNMYIGGLINGTTDNT